uniref:Exportin n=1 Tax=Cucumis melo subsp. melo TaxID=412675 RepID=E5GCF5_CUCME|nr:exportin [Cucumis melo subsp. melo]
MGLEYLINISYVDDNEVFKVCLDYWNSLVLELFETHHNMDNPAVSANMMGLQVPLLSGVVDGLGAQLMQRRQLYSGPMSKLRMLMICRMAKPEEVLIVEDENGNIVRETMKDNDVLVQYKSMRETLIYLSHLDHDDTEKQMLKKLSRQLSGEDWSWNNLNTLCWAIGSISGSMMEDQENRFLVMVIRDLLNLCEITKGKDNKAVIASNIMYVVGQYPRFLRAHWKFLKTVVNKLFEFMHETHPGVQDMACDTFLKIVQKCKRKFVIVQVGESEPFVSELLTSLPTTVADLEPHQIHTFYESVGNMIQAEPDPQKRDEYLQRLMDLPNQTNTSVASSLGTYFLPQISLIFLDMLNVYRMYSELISSSIAGGGPYTSKTSYVKLLRSVKRETLKLIETFLDKAEDQPQIGKQFVPPMMEPVLLDYARNLPDAQACSDCVPLQMITKNFEDYPEHRLKFFSLLRAIATYCFPALIRLSSQAESGVLTEPLWDAATVTYPYPNNVAFVREYTIKLLSSSFPNMTAAEDNKDLYAEEAAAQRERERQRMLTIPGLIAPNEIQDEMVDS